MHHGSPWFSASLSSSFFLDLPIYPSRWFHLIGEWLGPAGSAGSLSCCRNKAGGKCLLAVSSCTFTSSVPLFHRSKVLHGSFQKQGSPSTYPQIQKCSPDCRSLQIRNLHISKYEPVDFGNPHIKYGSPPACVQLPKSRSFC